MKVKMSTRVRERAGEEGTFLTRRGGWLSDMTTAMNGGGKKRAERVLKLNSCKIAEEISQQFRNGCVRT